jgi:hypothetical protein
MLRQGCTTGGGAGGAGYLGTGGGGCGAGGASKVSTSTPTLLLEAGGGGGGGSKSGVLCATSFGKTGGGTTGGSGVTKGAIAPTVVGTRAQVAPSPLVVAAPSLPVGVGQPAHRRPAEPVEPLLVHLEPSC